MPLFEFICPDCGVVVEKLQRYDSEPPRCSEHGDKDPPVMIRRVSRSSFVLKGGGWARTGYS